MRKVRKFRLTHGIPIFPLRLRGSHYFVDFARVQKLNQIYVLVQPFYLLGEGVGRDNFELFVMVNPVYGYDVRGSETKKRIKELNSTQRLRDPGDCLEEAGTAKIWRTAVSHLLKTLL